MSTDSPDRVSSPTPPLDCYCELWETDPGSLEGEGVPRGYCGFCSVCGEPGHVRHYPGPRPYTGAWCDEHYEELARSATFGPRELLAALLGVLLVVGLVMALIG